MLPDILDICIFDSPDVILDPLPVPERFRVRKTAALNA
jgi:hypothetical protein